MIASTTTSRRRAGASLLELLVAFVLFGIALAGLGPLVVMHLKQVATLERRLSKDTTYYLSPSSNIWARKLGAAATITATEPEPVETTETAAANTVEILSLNIPFVGEDLTAVVLVTEIPE